MHLSARAAITKEHKVSELKHRNFLSQVLEVRNSRPRSQHGWSLCQASLLVSGSGCELQLLGV